MAERLAGLAWASKDGALERLSFRKRTYKDPGPRHPRAPVAGGHVANSAHAQSFRLSPLRLNCMHPLQLMKPLPSGEALSRLATWFVSSAEAPDCDDRLVQRCECARELFVNAEEEAGLPEAIRKSPSVAEFLSAAFGIIHRREVRANLSLKLQVREILLEEGLREWIDFESRAGLGASFLFPRAEQCRASDAPGSDWLMLAVRWNCNDEDWRSDVFNDWRMVLSGTEHIPAKHLLTFEEELPESQQQEMVDAGVRLIMPATLAEENLSSKLREHWMTFGDFVRMVKIFRDIS